MIEDRFVRRDEKISDIAITQHALDRFRDRTGDHHCGKQDVAAAMDDVYQVPPTRKEKNLMQRGQEIFYSESFNLLFLVGTGSKGDRCVITCYPPADEYGKRPGYRMS